MNAHTPVLTEHSKRPSQLKADDKLLDTVFNNPESKEFVDLRDRAAYVLTTGTFPTHLRTLMTGLLRKITTYSRHPVSLDGRMGSLRVVQENIERLGLNDHPMVRKAGDYVKQGYLIQMPRDPKARRPYSKVLLYKNLGGTVFDRLTVQDDGSVKEGWG